MKLKQAIDKAKKERQEQSSEKKPPRKSAPVPEFADEWTPPDYRESAAVGLNPQTMEESRCVCMFHDSPEIEYYKVLRTQIQQIAAQKDWKTIMITSAHPNEGKTLTAINLSLTFAKAFNQTVLLVDCDLHKQNVKEYLGINSKKGLADHLIGNRPLKEIIVWPGIDKMTLISGGRTLEDSAEILGSPKMKVLVQEMKCRYQDRFIIFDTPPVLNKADTIAFSPLVDCIVMVVEEGKTPMQDAQKAIELLPKEKILGFVINKKKYSKKEAYANLYQ